VSVAFTAEEENLTWFQDRKAKAEKEIQENAIGVLRSRANDAQKELDEARKQFQTTAKKGG